MAAPPQGPRQSNRDSASTAGDMAPLRLIARDAAGLEVVSACLQDALTRLADIHYDPKRRRLALVASRYRWEAAANEDGGCLPPCHGALQMFSAAFPGRNGGAVSMLSRLHRFVVSQSPTPGPLRPRKTGVVRF